MPHAAQESQYVGGEEKEKGKIKKLSMDVITVKCFPFFFVILISQKNHTIQKHIKLIEKSALKKISKSS